jgi:IS30 family transposase
LQVGGPRLTEQCKAELWERWSQGESLASMARSVGRPMATVNEFIGKHGGIRPAKVCRAEIRLSLAEREEISRGLSAGLSVRAIADGLGRAPSTVSREVRRNGGRGRYRAVAADKAADARARRPKVCKLAQHPRLRTLVEDKLAIRWSPQQIAGWLARTHPDDAELQVSHETIYRTLYVQSRGALRKELTRHLRTRRGMRRPKNNGSKGGGRGQNAGMVHISQRPAEAEDRAVPGHWEGDLVWGTNGSAVATLVERWSRFLLLVKLDGVKSEIVVPALAEHVVTLPEQLRRSLTWDQGAEMAAHAQFTIDTGVQIYFCDPKSPWQRGSNENTNGLLRQYFPKRIANFNDYTQADLDAVAAELNGRPRKTLEYMTPSEKFNEAVALTP